MAFLAATRWEWAGHSATRRCTPRPDVRSGRRHAPRWALCSTHSHLVKQCERALVTKKALGQPHPESRADRQVVVIEVVAWAVQVASPFLDAVANEDVAARTLLQHHREVLTAGQWWSMAVNAPFPQQIGTD